MEVLTANSGMLFLVVGIAGLVVTTVVGLIVGHVLKRREQQIRERIWEEYR